MMNSNLIRLSLRSNLENNDLEGKIYYSNGIVNNISAQFLKTKNLNLENQTLEII